MRLAQKYLKLLNKRSPLSHEEAGARFVIREILGSRMYLDVNDEGICRDLLLDGIREVCNVNSLQKIFSLSMGSC